MCTVVHIVFQTGFTVIRASIVAWYASQPSATETLFIFFRFVSKFQLNRRPEPRRTVIQNTDVEAKKKKEKETRWYVLVFYVRRRAADINVFETNPPGSATRTISLFISNFYRQNYCCFFKKKKNTATKESGPPIV